MNPQTYDIAVTHYETQFEATRSDAQGIVDAYLGQPLTRGQFIKLCGDFVLPVTVALEDSDVQTAVRNRDASACITSLIENF